ncbi:hypothetical protein CBR_g42159 [Chara braunii]|uniref:Uncharacterized protein n=1 Tax=Chara braunii TaxID=69332 RepID=A0A388LX83_CHABU|nr:hypothetical protein CBR_g42159 [Chara braunii]|eukprot:GBG86875.1 hypothetical protein CBR_g42159 [Chara braunii]
MDGDEGVKGCFIAPEQARRMRAWGPALPKEAWRKIAQTPIGDKEWRWEEVGGEEGVRVERDMEFED